MEQWATAQGKGRKNRRNKANGKDEAEEIKGYTKADPSREARITIHDLPPEVHAHLFEFFNARELLWPVALVSNLSSCASSFSLSPQQQTNINSFLKGVQLLARRVRHAEDWESRRVQGGEGVQRV